MVDRWAVVIGVSKYENPSLNLDFAGRDAQEFYEFLRSPDGGEFKEENVELLINEDATVSAVNRAFRNFLKKPARDDLVVIYSSIWNCRWSTRAKKLALVVDSGCLGSRASTQRTA